jgi:hypothetical protein
MKEFMKRTLQNKRARMLAVLLVAGLAGTWAVGAARDKQEVAKMTDKMKTLCVGRFLIDMPNEARTELGKINIDGFDIASFGESDTGFQERLAAREAELRAKPDRLGGSNNLESVREVKTDSGLVGKIFIHGRTVTEGDAYKGAGEEHYRYEGLAVEALVHAKGVSIDLSTDNYDIDRIENLPRLVAKLVPNPDNRIPTEPGFCIDRAYVRDPLTAEQGEELVMHADLPSHPDVQFMLMLQAGLKSNTPGLLERNAEVNAKASFEEKMRVSTLRAAPRTIGTLTGDELVEKGHEENHTIGHSLQWEVIGTKDNVFVPDFSFEMRTGHGNREPVQSSLSDGAALGLWDKILSSIRIRPTQTPKASAAAPAIQIGAFVSAGNTCPADGWWECSASGNGVSVHRGQRQYFRKGERMPLALLLPPQTLWEKVRGLQSSYEDKTPTPWKLVDRRSHRRMVPDVPLAQATFATPAAATTAVVDAAIERTSVGTYAITGNPCPASGWWQCQESDALDGTRWFAQGSQLPAATFAVAGLSFGRTPDTPMVIQRSGTWQLVRLAQAPGTDDNASGEGGDPSSA